MNVEQLPDLLTVDDVIDYLNNDQNINLSENACLQYGIKGTLVFSVVPPLDSAITLRSVDGADSEYCVADYFRISKQMLKNIISSDNRQRITTTTREVDGKESQFVLSPYMEATKDSLRIDKQELQRFINDHLNNKAEKLPPYMDTGSDYYAKELDIAIKAHTAIFINNEGNSADSNSGRVMAWLKKHYRKESESDGFLRRVKTVVLPKNK